MYSASDNHKTNKKQFENADRVNITVNYLKIVDKYNKLITNPTKHVREDILDLIVECHGPTILDTFEDSSDSGNDYWYFDPDTYVNKLSFECVMECVSILMTSLENIINGSKYQYLLIRPPGHHCLNKGSGFCLLNNVFILSEYAIQHGYKKVMIVDYDYHHGNGTQELVKDKKDRFFISIHAHAHYVYPGTGSIEDNQENIINIPLDITNVGDDAKFTDDICYLMLKEELDKSVESFKPDLILISNGFDLHIEDPVGGLNVTGSFYTDTTKLLKTYDVPLIYVLEGGYVPDVIKDISIEIIDELLI